MKRILGVSRNYDWGSRNAIQDFAGLPIDGEPIAEVWFGAHPDSPSPLFGTPGSTLLDAIADDPIKLLGPEVADRYGSLPFLLKLLAPRRSVSLQVHPTPEIAQQGFEAEEAAGVSRTADNRRYRDSKHKPEMVLAITPFEGLVGFRSQGEVVSDLNPLTSQAAVRVRQALTSAGPEPRRAALMAALSSTPAEVREFITDIAIATRSNKQLAGVVQLGRDYPTDAGVVASILLNRFVLGPGEAIFVSDGMPHAYASGLCVEVMANSDNVLRAGLTTKLVDIAALLDTIDFAAEAYKQIPKQGSSPHASTLRPDADEFALWTAWVDGGSAAECDLTGPRIALGIKGNVCITSGTETTHLTQGDAVFVSGTDGSLVATGSGSLVIAGMPKTD